MNATKKLTKTTQATMTFNYEIGDLGNCEIKATWFVGQVIINSVRLNSTYAFVTLTPAQKRDITNVARWYFQDEIL